MSNSQGLGWSLTHFIWGFFAGFDLCAALVLFSLDMPLGALAMLISCVVATFQSMFVTRPLFAFDYKEKDHA